jgi:hypothetical protein
MRGTDEVQLKKKTEKKTKKTPQIICMGKQVTCKFERNEQLSWMLISCCAGLSNKNNEIDITKPWMIRLSYF